MEYKHCPFCGGYAEVIKVEKGHYNNEGDKQFYYYVTCMNSNENCLVQPETSDRLSEIEAVRIWNKREE